MNSWSHFCNISGIFVKHFTLFIFYLYLTAHCNELNFHILKKKLTSPWIDFYWLLRAFYFFDTFSLLFTRKTPLGLLLKIVTQIGSTVSATDLRRRCLFGDFCKGPRPFYQHRAPEILDPALTLSDALIFSTNGAIMSQNLFNMLVF